MVRSRKFFHTDFLIFYDLADVNFDNSAIQSIRFLIRFRKDMAIEVDSSKEFFLSWNF